MNTSSQLLVVDHVLFHELHNFLSRLLVRLLLGLGLHVGPHKLRTRLSTRDSDNSHISNSMVTQEHTLEFSRGNLEAIVFDQFLDAVGDDEVAVCVFVTDVTGFVPSVRREGFLGCLFCC